MAYHTYTHNVTPRMDTVYPRKGVKGTSSTSRFKRTYLLHHRNAILQNNRNRIIPMKSSPYLGYLRHAPSSAQSIVRNRDSPYVGFMRHAPPSSWKLDIAKCHQHSAFMGKKIVSITSASASASASDAAETNTQYEYCPTKNHKQFAVSGRLPGGNPQHGTSYSICRWFETNNIMDHRRRKNNDSYSDLDIVAALESFDRLAFWFLFPIAYDERASYSFRNDAHLEHMQRGFTKVILPFLSSIVKRILPGKDEDHNGSSRIDKTQMVNARTYNKNNNTPTIITDDHSDVSFYSDYDYDPTNNNSNNNNNNTNKNTDGLSNHALQVSVSSLAKAYHTEQARQDLYQSIEDMSSDEFQRHLDIESILRLPTITYRSKDTTGTHAGVCQAVPLESTSILTSESSERISPQTQTAPMQESSSSSSSAASCDQDSNEEKAALEWSWVSVPNDPVPSEEKELQNLDAIPEQQESSNAISQNHSHEEHCVICLEQFIDGDRLRVLPCGHRFHTTCIDKWLSGSCSHDDCYTGLCPTCRKTPSISNSPSFDVGEDDSLGTMGEETRLDGSVPSWAFARLGGALAKEN